MTRIVKTRIYDNFKCIADRCSFSCCKSWDIAIDSTVFDLWEKDNELVDLIRSDYSGAFIKLRADKACPFLNEKELCSLILTGRDKFLTEICRSFPRVVNHYGDTQEFSLSCACPETVDLIYKCNGNNLTNNNRADITNSNETRIRDVIISLLLNKKYLLNQRIILIFHMLLTLKEKPEDADEIIDLYQDNQFLQSIMNGFLNLTVPVVDKLAETNELLLDITENYYTEPAYNEYLKDIRATAKTYEGGKKLTKTKWSDFITSYQVYDKLLTDVIVQKIFGEGPDAGAKAMLLALQMLITEYIMIRYSVFLRSLAQKIDYKDVRDYIVVYSRIIGYNIEGIREFWQDSFESEIWELGYVILLLG